MAATATATIATAAAAAANNSSSSTNGRPREHQQHACRRRDSKPETLLLLPQQLLRLRKRAFEPPCSIFATEENLLQVARCLCGCGGSVGRRRRSGVERGEMATQRGRANHKGEIEDRRGQYATEHNERLVGRQAVLDDLDGAGTDDQQRRGNGQRSCWRRAALCTAAIGAGSVR